MFLFKGELLQFLIIFRKLHKNMICQHHLSGRVIFLIIRKKLSIKCHQVSALFSWKEFKLLQYFQLFIWPKILCIFPPQSNIFFSLCNIIIVKNTEKLCVTRKFLTDKWFCSCEAIKNSKKFIEKFLTQKSITTFNLNIHSFSKNIEKHSSTIFN